MEVLKVDLEAKQTTKEVVRIKDADIVKMREENYFIIRSQSLESVTNFL